MLILIASFSFFNGQPWSSNFTLQFHRKDKSTTVRQLPDHRALLDGDIMLFSCIIHHTHAGYILMMGLGLIVAH